EVVNDLVIKRLQRRLLRVQLRLDVECLNQRIGVEEQLQDRPKQPAHERQEPAVGLEKRRILELEVRRQRGFAFAPELLEQIRTDAARIQEFLELDVRKFANLFFGIVDTAFLADPRPDLSHDLLDVDVVGA